MEQGPSHIRASSGAAIIRVGLTEAHGMAVEQSQYPPEGVEYVFLRPTRSSHPIIKSAIKGFMRSYASADCDLIEAVISPVITRQRWIYSCENFQVPAAFTIWGASLPRFVRVAAIRRLLLQPNCRTVVFWSRAGQETLRTYGGLESSDQLWQKTTVVYPAVRTVPAAKVRMDRSVRTLLFSGDFFRKGGVNVVDAFETLKPAYPDLTLLLCCDKNIDFNTPNAALRAEYLSKVQSITGIELLGRRPRSELLEQILPSTDVYLLPTYVETFGMAILEAMAYGIPVIATNHFAIPEMVINGETGILIDTAAFDCERLFRGYVVRTIPDGFRRYVTASLCRDLSRLIETPALVARLGVAALERARSVFSFDARNKRMLQIYRDAMQ